MSAPDQPYTLNDIRELLCYRRKRAEFITRLRSMSPGQIAGTKIARLVLGPAYMSFDQASLFDCPQPGRFTDMRAVELPVYRWAIKAARAEYHNELDEETLLLLVGGIACRTKKKTEVLMQMPLDEFSRLCGLGSSVELGWKGSRRPGRPSETDHALDQRIYEAWKSGMYKTYTDLARGFSLLNAHEARKVVDRHRHRLTRMKTS